MNTEKDENQISEHFPLADIAQARKEQYEKAVATLEQFEHQYSPKFVDYDEDYTKIIYWDDEHGKRHYEYEEITDDEKEQLDDAWDIVNIYEEYYRDEYFEVEPEPPNKQPIVEQAIADMQNIRDRTDTDPNRLQSFRENIEQSPSPLPEKELPDERDIDL